MSKMTEAQIEKRLGKLVQERGGLYFKFVSPSNPGVPDRIIITPDGRTIYVELKTTIGSLQRIQQWQLERMKQCGADVRVIKGWDAAKEFVEEVMPQ